ncbi:MAG: glycosyltransferase [Armatimonadota bacterium]|nr:glycosyltransferase family 4 protein [bacterium]
MKVMFLSTWFPYPPDNGARIRSYHIIKALSAKHDVYLISLLQDDSDPAQAENLADICKVVSLHPSRWFKPGTLKSLLGYFSSRPRSAVDTFDPCVRSAVESTINDIKPDVIVASTLGMAEYAPHSPDILSILDEHNCEHAVLRRNTEHIGSPLKRFRYTLGWKKFARWESAICRKFDTVITVSKTDRQLLLQAAPDLKNVQVVTNGVDIDHYNPNTRHPAPNALIYNGAMTYGANLDAIRYYAHEIYPLLRESEPDVKLHVTGRTDNVDLSGIADCPGVAFTGYIDDIRTILAASSVCIVPLRQGGGSRLKILEAMAAGVPVVSTNVGAEGIEAADRKHLLIADSPRDFADAILSVLSNESIASELSANARQLVEEKYSWSTLGRMFVDIMESTRPTADI